jgi:hypothetical protein
MGTRPDRIVAGANRLTAWAALGVLAVLLVGSLSVSQTLWAKVLTGSGSVNIATWTATPPPIETPTPEPAQGCTLGFWRQEGHFDLWPEPYRPEDLTAAAFGLAELEGDPTLLQSLEAGGGGLSAFLRQAVAALLNAAHPDVAYAYSVEEVLELVQTAFATEAFEAIKDPFEAASEADCPLPGEAASDESEPEPVLSQVEVTEDPTSTASLTPTPTPTPTPSPTPQAELDASPTPEPLPSEEGSATPTG